MPEKVSFPVFFSSTYHVKGARELKFDPRVWQDASANDYQDRERTRTQEQQRKTEGEEREEPEQTAVTREVNQALAEGAFPPACR